MYMSLFFTENTQTISTQGGFYAGNSMLVRLLEKFNVELLGVARKTFQIRSTRGQILKIRKMGRNSASGC